MALAPWLFCTKVARPVIRRKHELGIKTGSYTTSVPSPNSLTEKAMKTILDRAQRFLFHHITLCPPPYKLSTQSASLSISSCSRWKIQLGGLKTINSCNTSYKELTELKEEMLIEDDTLL